MRRHQVGIVAAAAGVVVAGAGAAWLTTGSNEHAGQTPQAVAAAAVEPERIGAGQAEPAQPGSAAGRSPDIAALASAGDAGQSIAAATEAIINGEPADPGNASESAPAGAEPTDPGSNQARDTLTETARATEPQRQSQDVASIESLEPLTDQLGRHIEPTGPVDAEDLAALLDDGSTAQSADEAEAEAAPIDVPSILDSEPLGERISTALTEVSTGGGEGPISPAAEGGNAPVAANLPNGGGAVSSVANGLVVSQPGLGLEPDQATSVNTDLELVRELAEAMQQLQDGPAEAGEGNGGGGVTRPESVPTPSAIGGGLILMSLLAIRRRREAAVLGLRNAE
jgi:hypothetical protein